MTNTAKTFDAYAGIYEDKFNRNPLGKYQREQVHAALAPYLRSGMAVLDVGCGPGSDFAFYKEHNLSVDALDISEKMVQLARHTAGQLGLAATISHCDLAAFQPDRTYDAILLNFGVINAIAVVAAALAKLRHLLKPDGVLVIVAMPPFHLFTVLEGVFRLRFCTVFRRIFMKKLSLANGMEVRYLSKNAFAGRFKVVKKINLCAILPTPDQYRQSRLARRISRILLPVDRAIAAALPDACGGDHICYLLRKEV